MGDKGWGDGRFRVEWRWEIRGGVMEDLVGEWRWEIRGGGDGR